MKKFKYIFLLLVVILLTGCSGNYNLTINDDMSISEELYLSISNEDDLYEKTLKIFEENNISKDNYDVVVKEEKVEITYKDKFNTIEEYILDSKIYHHLFKEIQYNKSNNYIDLYVNENLKIKNNYNLINGSNLMDLDVIQINVTNPFEVNFSNAEIINDNIYTWTVKKGDTHKKIQMQFKPQLNIFPYREVIVTSVVIVCFVIIILSIFIRYKKRQKV